MKASWLRRMALALLCAMAGLTGSAVSAQEIGPERYAPHGVGNRWEYAVRADASADIPWRFLVYEVVGDTVLAGNAVPLVQARAFDRQRREMARSTCLLIPGSTPRAADPSPVSCANYLPGFGPIFFERVRNAMITVAASPYPADALSVSVSGTGAGSGPYFHHVTQYATDLGAYHHEYRRSDPATGAESYWEADLIHAEVAGTAYGASAVSIETPSTPPKGAFRITSAFPNPFRDELHLEAEGAAPGPLVLDVFDLLGRRLMRREAPPASRTVQLVIAPGPSGVYFVRLTDSAGRHATRAIIRSSDSAD